MVAFIISKRPDEVPRIIERSFLYNQVGKFDLGLKDAERAKSLDQKNVGAIIARAVSLMGLNRTSEGFEEFDRGLVVDPNNSEIWKRKGDVYVKLGQKEKALECYDTALKLWPAYPDANSAKAALMHTP